MSRARRQLERVAKVGVRAAIGSAANRVDRYAKGTLRGRRLARRPLAASRNQVEAALGGLTFAEALGGSALDALPTAAAFERSLAALDEGERAGLLARADAIAEHRFDLLGSGPTDLTAEIDWSRDFKSGRRWPQQHFLLLQGFYPDDSDHKVPWELSRFQHLPLLAAAYRLSGEDRYIAEIGAQLQGWIAANPVEIGINWLCTMDVAIRAANWVAALVICAPEAAEQPWADEVASSLLLHGRFISGNLETGPIRTNHFLADVVGLLIIAAVFSRGREGQDWGRMAVDALIAEMDHQVRADGCAHEASIPYHRLDTELFLCGTQAGDALFEDPFPASYRDRLDRMLDFTAGYTRPDGLAPQIGDNDDGRFLPLDDYAKRDSRSHLHLFEQAGRGYVPSTGSSAFPAGGYYVMRHDGVYVLIRCGDTGMYGRGGHAHNDQLSFELAYGEQPLIEDPGTYTYYTDRELRPLFRSTAFHSTLRIDEGEQNEMPEWPRFPLGGRSRAEAIEWVPGSSGGVFVGRHHGFEYLSAPALHERRFELTGRELTIVDSVVSAGDHALAWTFPLGPGGTLILSGDRAVVDFDRVKLTIEAEAGTELAVRDGLYSPGYGRKEPRQFVVARGRSEPGDHTTRFRLRIE